MDVKAGTGIELHIEELVLDGFARRDRYDISRALEHELIRLFAERGIPGLLHGGADLAQVDAGAFEAGPGARGRAIGEQLAQAVYRRFTR